MKTIVVRGRVIRYEDGKEAEIFTLVIAGTNEIHWFDTSSAGKSIIEITEKELDEILAYKPNVGNETTVSTSQLLFRL